MKKRYFALLAVAVLMAALLLCGCAFGNGDKDGIGTDGGSPSTEPEDVSADVDTPEDAPEADPSELLSLRRRIADSGSFVGIAYAGNVENRDYVDNAASYLEGRVLLEKYPFLSDVKFFDNKGENIFVLVPKSESGRITLYSAGIDGDGELSVDRDTEIFTGEPGEVLVLRCNESENFSNVLVRVTDGDTILEFYPTVSLEDGRSVDLQSGCCDLTEDDIGFHVDEGYYLIGLVYPNEVNVEGEELLFLGVEEFCNERMLAYELGSVGDSGEFETVRRFMVSYGGTYMLKDREWTVVETGISDLEE